MKRRTQMVRVLLVALPLLGGCASYANLGSADGWKVYGGTRLDATIISEGFAPDPAVVKDKKLEHPVLFMEGCSGLIDMPFSAIADTAMLPITVPIAISRMAATTEQETHENTKERKHESNPRGDN